MLKGDLRKKQILETAERLFCENGYEKTSVQDILDVLRLSKGSFYHHYESKELLLSCICEKRAQASAEELAEDVLAANQRHHRHRAEESDGRVPADDAANQQVSAAEQQSQRAGLAQAAAVIAEEQVEIARHGRRVTLCHRGEGRSGRDRVGEHPTGHRAGKRGHHLCKLFYHPFLFLSPRIAYTSPSGTPAVFSFWNRIRTVSIMILMSNLIEWLYM